MRLFSLLVVFLLGLFTLMSAPTTSAQSTYIITDLGTLPSANTSVGRAINNSGQVTGESGDGTVFGSHAFIYRSGGMVDPAPASAFMRSCTARA